MKKYKSSPSAHPIAIGSKGVTQSLPALSGAEVSKGVNRQLFFSGRVNKGLQIGSREDTPYILRT